MATAQGHRFDLEAWIVRRLFAQKCERIGFANEAPIRDP
jgi:hypothetical protein